MLSPQVLKTFLKLLHFEVKGLKVGKGTLECAVCFIKFEDNKALCLLPRCSHVFHLDYIDV
ncbi:E3 ubiquitin-protein ligase [Musa troglodytarum]|uniref:RING-type E3 ubiquitin transferase n=1 Tax=Musa troglodytarum TaxID=320322 RepID=A0A9E7HK74_9LILI|nr:E3 ubiquitin-protein ligase [Musa troglodytarum]